ncbi:hypothetical protein CDAR_477491 [Caerostris darwini]|uniref:Uncharacterized protein n=1 Tax=Caerostris darwini TaxID=1538125 RepID=A0AAV4RRQ6_9ARAC|nr:hypothetical protein CDAR_477491 [Caerostris darwini]
MTHIWEEREREEIIIAPHLFERKEKMADNPKNLVLFLTCRWREETILPALLLREERRGHQKPNRAKTEQERKIERRMGGREGKNIHKNPVIYVEEETFQRFRTEIIEACKTSPRKKDRWLSRSLSNDAHLGGERKWGNNYSASFIRTERNNGGQPRKTWPYSDLQMERRNDSPRTVIEEERRGHQKANRAKTEQERKIERRMGGREGKNIHKTPLYTKKKKLFRGSGAK